MPSNFDPDAYIASTNPAPSGGFDPDAYLAATEQSPWHGEHTLMGAGKNLASDIGSTISGFGKLGDQFVAHPMDTATTVAKGIVPGIIGEGKRLGVGELLTGHPINAVEKFGQAAYDKPLTTGLDVAPVIGAAGKALGIGSEVAETADVGAQAAKEAAGAAEEAIKPVPEELEAIGGQEAKGVPPSQMPPDPNAVPPKAPIPPADPIREVKDYISGKYSDYAKKPGSVASIADYIQEKSQMMANQQLGATPLQARQVGHDAMRAIGQYALDNDIVSPGTGLRGMRAKQLELMNAAGEKLGVLREEADALRDVKTNPVDVLQEVRAKLDPKYARGPYAGESGQYAKALESVEDSEATHAGLAKTATELNKAANKALRLQQPHGPYTDVANEISEANNARIRQLLGPKKAAEYDAALKEFGVNKKIGEFLKRKEAGEVKRIGAGSFTSNMIQKGMDEMGYRVGASGMNKLSTAVLKNPSIAKDLPSLFKEFIHQVDLPEPTAGGMAQGGIVGEEMNDFLEKKYGTTK